MKNSSFHRAFAVAALAVAALVAIPTAAQAVDSYPPSDSYIVSTPPATVEAGGTFQLGFGAGSFAPGQAVSFSLTGENATGATLATFRTVANDLGVTKNAAGDGSLSTAVTLPSNAAGQYTLVASTTGWERTWVFNIAGSGSAPLSETGSNNTQLLALWIGGGALAFIGGGLVVASAVRKQRKQTV